LHYQRGDFRRVLWCVLAPVLTTVGCATHTSASRPAFSEPSTAATSDGSLHLEPPTAAVASGIPGLPELDLELDQLQDEYDIPIEVNEEVIRYIRLFQSSEYRAGFVQWLSRSHRYLPRFRAILRQEGVPEDTAYVAMIESGFAPQATSPAGAAGPWQFIAETGARHGLKQDAWVDERRDPEKAAAAAGRFLRALRDTTGDWYLAWAGFNAGPGRIARAMELGHTGFWEMAAAPDVLPRETRTYVPKILAAAIISKHPSAFGFQDEEIEPERWIEYAEVTLVTSTALSALAAAAAVSVQDLRDLNPELRGSVTPPRRYSLKIPIAKADTFAASWPRMSKRIAREARARKPAARHRVQPGDTLWSLSRKHGVTVQELATWNGIRAPERHTLRSGTLLKLAAKR
jgi:membrane-bound lytic murein transglycosylase D